MYKSLGALLRAPKVRPLDSTVREVFHTSGFPGAVLNVELVKDGFAVHTKVHSLDSHCLSYLTEQLHSDNVAIVSAEHGLTFLFS